ncbi:MAG TPA: DUF4212 domain-containing protein [Gammaproteobacteria bacterium]|nr:DUF4212 domain-containing protein [Gammaproteobacteria bacterium]
MSQNSVRYWRTNLRLMLGCLSIWFLVSFGCGILWVEWLNEFRLGGYPLGFWFAQQGSIFTFVVLVFFYAFKMRQIDKRFGVAEE